jgi:hypothetical protein
MPAHRPDPAGDVEFALQECDATGKPLTTHMFFMLAEDFAKEYAPVRRRPKPSNPKVRVRNRTKTKPTEKNNEKTELIWKDIGE